MKTNMTSSNSSKNETIFQPLNTVRQRQRIQKMIEGTAWGFLLSSVITVFVLLIFLFTGFSNLVDFSGQRLVLLIFFAVLFGFCFGAVVGFFLPIDRHESARQADQYYHFKDRLLTATKLLSRSETTPMERLQLEDAAYCARNIDPKSVVPYKLPSRFFAAIIVTVISLTVGIVSPYFVQQQNAVAAVRLPEIINVAETLQNELVEKIEELAEQNPEEKNLKELSGELQKLVSKLDQSATNPKEALSTLSEMEEAIRSVLSEFQMETFDASMKEVAEAMSAAEATRAISQALKDEKYAKAAEELKKFDAQTMKTMSKQERNAIGDQMRKTLNNMDQRNQKTLQKTTQKLADAFDDNDGEKVQEGTDEFAAECNKQALRKEISNSLEGKLALLGLSKSECNGNGGQSDNSNNGGNNTNKSDSADKNWGTGAAGNPTSGEKTHLDSQREQKNVTGIIGQGESEYEKINTNEAPQEKNAVREQRESFQEYHKIAETVLESEPIPLGQRQMIRRYFESIRPNDEETK
ncbi:MAG: hypothetical protein LBC02_02365 [Planctomycetaceae bacterium]|jgi:hypothetical protein|nr:hypothetical protein [Planctomycetaceae bacterium]